MKKYLKSFLWGLVGLLVTFGPFSVVMAQDCGSYTCGYNIFWLFGFLNNYGHCLTLNDLPCVIASLVDALLIFAIIYAVIRIIIAGIGYSAAIGNPEKQAQAKNAVIWSAIGLLVVACAYALIIFIRVSVSQ